MTSTNPPPANAPPSVKGEKEVCVDCAPDPTPLNTNTIPTTEPNKKEDEKREEEKKEDLLDPSTFVPPIRLDDGAAGMIRPMVVIEYCQRCKFGLRANWIQQELLSTFAPSNETAASVASIMLIPKIDDISSGRFRIYILPSSSPPTHPKEEEKKAGLVYEGGLKLVWDRKTEGGFPEMKILKQKIRDHINPSFGLGHSDRK